jgi:membrane protease YdiL (CAAX protease family)
VQRLWPGFEAWQTETLGFPFPVFVDVAMVAVALLAIALRRRPLAAYGIRFDRLRPQLDIAATCFIPFALAGFPLGMGIDYKSWGGAVILSVVEVVLLLVLAWLLRNKPAAAGAAAVSAGIILIAPAAQSIVGQAIVLFLTYAVFVGFGEEILYRGYMHSRLNETFGTPYSFAGVAFGWGTILTALLFGLTHVGILRWILGTSTEVTFAWGLWTFFGGLGLAFVREKSGGILAPPLMHGLPQAVAVVAMLFLA